MFVTEALTICLSAYDADVKPDKDVERTAVKEVLAHLSSREPGKAVELRIPPYAAIQLIAGPTHRRGTPSAVVETSAQALLEMAAGRKTWTELKLQGTVLASGERSDLSHLFPC